MDTDIKLGTKFYNVFCDFCKQCNICSLIKIAAQEHCNLAMGIELCFVLRLSISPHCMRSNESSKIYGELQTHKQWNFFVIHFDVTLYY